MGVFDAIVGKPFAVKAAYATVVLQCQCVAKEPVILFDQSPGQCPACKRMYVIEKFQAEGAEKRTSIAVIAEPVGAVITT